MRVNDDKNISKKRALEAVKQMLQKTRGEADSPEMNWDYYGIHT